MTETRRRPPHARRPRARALVPAIACLLGALALPATAPAAPGHLLKRTHSTKLVRYRGYRARVPASWPVFRLGHGSRTCVRFNRHAVYLGSPGADQLCPPHAAGRTEALLVSPETALRGASADTTILSPTGPGAAAARGSVAQVSRPAERVVVTATWNRDPAAVRSALGVRSARAAARAYDRRRPAPAPAARRAAASLAVHADAARGHARFPIGPGPGAPGAVYTGLGFDACSTPSTSAMSAWLSSPFRAAGVYIGGANMACSQPNLTASWVSTVTTSGWHLIPIYVGLQAPANGCGCAAISSATTTATGQGAAAARDAIAHAQAIGLGQGNPLYFDMENYTRSASSSAAVLAFLSGWTTQLHAGGYRSGVYSSDDSGIDDLVAKQGTGYAEPDDIWNANWNGQQSTADPAIPSTDWANHQRLHQFEGGHVDDYGGTRIDIDGDYVDAATASAGSGRLTTTIAAAPSISVRPQSDGTIDLYPSWSGQAGVGRWEILAGTTPTALTPLSTVRAGGRGPVIARSAYAYFRVQALNAAGQMIGTSGTVATRAHVAVFGRSAFVPAKGTGGVPVACYGTPSCRVTTTVTVGRTLLTRTHPESVAGGGGIVHFALPGGGDRLVARAPHRRLPVTISVRTSTGQTASRPIDLVPFATAGRGPRRTPGASSTLRILGATDFVSHGWAGGVLAVCASATPCSARTAVTVHGRIVSQPAAAQTLGAREVGYLSFRMTAAGHRLLRRARGNQLGARVSVTSVPTTAATPPTPGGAAPATGGATAGAPPAPGSTTSALIALDAF